MKQLLLLLLISISFSQNENRLSIIDFENQTNQLSTKEISIIGNRIETLLVQSDKFQVITINERDAILSEQKFQNASGCVDLSCAVEVGRLLGATFMISGSVGQFGSAYVITAKMFNVETGEIEKAAEYYTTNHKIEELLIQGVENIINQLTGETTHFDNTISNIDQKTNELYSDTLTQVTIHITTTPKRANARLYIDEQFIGKILPSGIEFNTNSGIHWIRIESDKFETIEKEIILNKNRSKRNIKLKRIKTNHRNQMMNKMTTNQERPKLTLSGGISAGFPAGVNGNFRAHYRFLNFELSGGENKEHSFKGDQVSIGFGTKKFVVNYIEGKWYGEQNVSQLSSNYFEQDEYTYNGWSIKSFKKLLFWEIGVVKSDLQIKDFLYVQAGISFSITF